MFDWLKFNFSKLLDCFMPVASFVSSQPHQCFITILSNIVVIMIYLNIFNMINNIIKIYWNILNLVLLHVTFVLESKHRHFHQFDSFPSKNNFIFQNFISNKLFFLPLIYTLKLDRFARQFHLNRTTLTNTLPPTPHIDLFHILHYKHSLFFKKLFFSFGIR